MKKNTLKFLQQLSESFGPSGFERDALRIAKEYVSEFADEVRNDNLGSLLFTKRGESESPVVLLPGHIDEVGFVISGISAEGFLSFNPVGGWFDQVLLGQRVKVRTKDGTLLLGIIAATPPHLLSPESREKVVKKEDMFIDIGCANLEEVQALGVRLGDPVVPDSTFSTMEKTVFTEKKKTGTMTIAVGKGFDDRIGTLIAAEVVRRLQKDKIPHPNTVVGAATVMEEIGARGARTTAHIINPDVCLTLEVDISGDVPGVKPHQAPAKMGKGPTVCTYDSSMIPNQPLKELIIDTAEKHKIPYQLSQVARGGTDGGVIHMSNAGCPTVVIGIATRHIHSHVGMLSLEDVEQCITLVIEVVKQLDAKTVAGFTAM